MEWINIEGCIFLLGIMLPNICYAYKFHVIQQLETSKIFLFIEQLGRYTAMFFLCFHIGLLDDGFPHEQAHILYLLINVLLLLSYWIFWILYFHKQTVVTSMMLAFLPTLLFLCSGILSRNWLLLFSGILFGSSHLYITYQSAKGGSYETM